MKKTPATAAPGIAPAFAILPVESLFISPCNVRTRDAARDLDSLVANIRAHGLIQPLVVRPSADGRFEVIAGQRRLIACQRLAEERPDQAARVPCLIQADLDEGGAVAVSLAENVERLPMEEFAQCEAFERLLQHGRGIKEIAASFGVPQKVVKQRLALAGLIEPIKTLVRERKLDGDDAQRLALVSPERQRAWLALRNDPQERAPVGYQLKQWLFGGQPISTQVALFALKDCPEQIVEDLFGTEPFRTSLPRVCMPRMRILTASEQEAFDRPPLFDHRERQKFFTFPKALLDMAQSMRSVDHRVGFLVSCGYFRATRRFFAPVDCDPRDVAYVASQLGNAVASIDPYPDRTRQRHQQLILDFYGFAPFDEAAKKAVTAEIATMTRMHLKPRLIFDRCVDFLIQRRVQVPKAGALFELIRLGLHTRKAELVTLMETHLTDEARHLLDDLFAASEERNRYQLTLLKKRSSSTKPTRIKEGIADFETLAALYRPLEGILSVLDLGVAGIRYYAGSVLKSEVFQIHRREANDRYIHAAAFVAHQFFRGQDHLVDLWLSVMASFQTTTAREHQEKLLETRKDQQKQLKIGG